MEEIAERFQVDISDVDELLISEHYNGFDHHPLPVILDIEPDILTTNYTWGLVPTGKPIDLRKGMLNARCDTIHQKPSFAPSLSKRCLIMATGYYDWHWNDPKGKSKTKYQINSKEDELFAFAGIYNSWMRSDNTQINTFSIVTTFANETMRWVHNRKEAENDQRMPIVLHKGQERAWLNSKIDVREFDFPSYNVPLFAMPI